MVSLTRLPSLEFEDAKQVLVALLAEVDEAHWAALVASTTKATFRSLCGGMGSLNDLTICPENAHKVDDRTSPKANVLLNATISLCIETSRINSLSLNDAIQRCLSVSYELTGFSCFDCGYFGTGGYQILSFLEPFRLRTMLSGSTSGESPAEKLLEFWRTDISQSSISELVRRLGHSGIDYFEGNGWMRSCHACGSGNTCVYRWQVSDTKIEPSSDNLKVPRKCALR